MKKIHSLGFMLLIIASCNQSISSREQGANNSSLNEEKNERMNILYIFTDDQSMRTLSCYNGSYDFVETPNIDYLASQGVRFQYAYTGAKCVPSRGNVLTGLLQHNYDTNTSYWISDLKAQGYHTGMIGKWHWNVPRVNETWTESIIWEHHLPNRDNYYWGQKVRINGGEEIILDQYSSDYYTDKTIEFIKNRAGEPDKPWFYWLCYAGVHGPYEPAKEDIGAYADADVTTPPDIFGPRPDKPEHLINGSMFTRNKNGEPIRGKENKTLTEWVRQYNESVRAIDRGVGRIMEALTATSQLENTMVIFTSDQGYAWGQHGYALKIAPYDANLLAPLIFANPVKIPKSKLIKTPVNGTDIIATIQHITQVIPTNPSDGRILTELIYSGNDEGWSNEYMVQTYTGHLYGNTAIREGLEKAYETDNWEDFIVHNSKTKSWMMLRHKNYKYVRHIYKDYIEELYDLDNDPEELVNLAVKEEFRDLLLKYRAQLLVEFEKKGATYLDLLPKPKEVIL
ncbi:MAG: sulfatase-like hydrolase/transferase [Bacteroidota bacterium]